ncbi:response regulator transcription factor [Rossellomorea aquimaris]|uniref:response regulator transcription factor n=1 Tax=Rossellomorea aquimaris TaxID=189382 RepID=UPI0011E97F78|nr:response regulator transcription factor [Rossellomorea aquimaris]TYS86187.1 response regulator transcription factor [Rossellomorea aquimaris]
MKIMIVEDEEIIRDMLEETVLKWGFDVNKTEEFNDVFGQFTNENPQLILLDINLPAFDGFYWCNKIRDVSSVPIIFISSRNTPMDMIMAMNMGGDDYIQKPFDTDVLMAKVNALLRRSYSYINADANILEHEGVVLNLKDWQLSYEGSASELTKTEFTILKILLQNKGAVVNRTKLMRALWKDESFVDDNTLTVNITRLRKKLADLGKEQFITTKKGEGYIIQ